MAPCSSQVWLFLIVLGYAETHSPSCLVGNLIPINAQNQCMDWMIEASNVCNCQFGIGGVTTDVSSMEIVKGTFTDVKARIIGECTNAMAVTTESSKQTSQLPETVETDFALSITAHINSSRYIVKQVSSAVSQHTVNSDVTQKMQSKSVSMNRSTIAFTSPGYTASSSNAATEMSPDAHKTHTTERTFSCSCSATEDRPLYTTNEYNTIVAGNLTTEVSSSSTGSIHTEVKGDSWYDKSSTLSRILHTSPSSSSGLTDGSTTSLGTNSARFKSNYPFRSFSSTTRRRTTNIPIITPTEAKSFLLSTPDPPYIPDEFYEE
ncbi:uncharacterized protein [Apostichopus japonicus]|uniref:uncharacterized protein n=1 Tax=Stichopus japonicus TaxID=307972 RepID=UPI003AB38728